MPEPVSLDRLFGVEGDWIGQHRCREAEIEGPLRAAEAEIKTCWSELERIGETFLDRTEEMRAVEQRLARAEAIYRPLIVRRVRLVVTLNQHRFSGDAIELVSIKVYKPSFFWLLLNEIFDLEDVARDALSSFRLRCALHSGIVSLINRTLSALILTNLLKALTTSVECLAWPPPDLRVARVVAGGGATRLFLPRP